MSKIFCLFYTKNPPFFFLHKQFAKIPASAHLLLGLSRDLVNPTRRRPNRLLWRLVMGFFLQNLSLAGRMSVFLLQNPINLIQPTHKISCNIWQIRQDPGHFCQDLDEISLDLTEILSKMAQIRLDLVRPQRFYLFFHCLHVGFSPFSCRILFVFQIFDLDCPACRLFKFQPA